MRPVLFGSVAFVIGTVIETVKEPAAIDVAPKSFQLMGGQLPNRVFAVVVSGFAPFGVPSFLLTFP
jgi:hypothetical protein